MTEYKDILESLHSIIDKKNIFMNEPMSKHTSFKIGGPADILLIPENQEQLVASLVVCDRFNVPKLVIGNGSNLIVRDKGIRGVVIKTFNCLNRVNVNGDIIEAEAGVLLSKLANVALQNGLTGLEFASGIPGTLGGAVAMNAGAYDGEMKDVTAETRYVDQAGNVNSVMGEEHSFGYRKSVFQGSDFIILSSKLKLNAGDVDKIKEKMDDYNGRRRDKQPLEMPSAGSVFRRPPGYFAGKLIEDCGLRGFGLGGAQVSEKHCGFIVNKGNASAEDVLQLIGHVQKCVKDKFGVELHTEVKVIGEE